MIHSVRATVLAFAMVLFPTASRLVAQEAQTHLTVAKAYPAARLPLVQSARELTKTVIRDRTGTKVATIQDLVLDLHSGRIWCAIVTPANLYGAPDFFAAIPSASFVSADAEGAVIKVAETNLISGPRFVASRWEPDALSVYMRQAFAAFHQALPADANPQLARASSFYGMNINNQSGANIGNLADFAVDLPEGRALFAVLALYGSEKNQHAVPTSVLAIAPNSRALVLPVDNAQLGALVRQNDYLWAAMSDPAFVAASYRAFGQQLAFDYSPAYNAGTVTTMLRTEPRILAPAFKPSPARDADITHSILAVLMSTDFDSDTSLQDLKISTRDGKVTLSGKVASETEKNRLGIIAERIVGADNVANNLTAR